MVVKIRKTMKLSDECRVLLEKLRKRLGVNDTSITEMAIRLMAKHEGDTATDEEVADWRAAHTPKKAQDK